jgi:lipopolysaccharide transport system permease protein
MHGESITEGTRVVMVVPPTPVEVDTALEPVSCDGGDGYELVIEAGRAERTYWADLWRYRELFYFLAWRDILVRYKQTVIGIAWSVIRPLLTMVVFTIVFGRIAGLPSEGAAPYAIMVFAAMLPWQFFSNSLSESSNSLIANASMVSKVYFPRLVIPTSTVIVNLVDFFISFVLLLVLMVGYQFMPGPRMLLLPVFLTLAFVTAMGAGLWLAALNVTYRDFRYIVPFIVQLGLFVSPVGFSSEVVPEQWRLLYSLNPMVGVIDGFRWSIIGEGVELYWPGFFLSICLSFGLLAFGIWYFRKTERRFADVI